MTIGILGGTGAIGTAIGARLAQAGHVVLLGSRDAERAAAVAANLRYRWKLTPEMIDGASLEAAAQADMVVVAVPADVIVDLAPLAPLLAGKAVLSAANALSRVDGQFVTDTNHSAFSVLGETFPRARLVTAFNHLAAKPFGDPSVTFDADVLVAGEDLAVAEATAVVNSVEGLHAVNAGGLAAAPGVEAFTAVLLNVNVRSGRVHGLRLVTPS